MLRESAGPFGSPLVHDVACPFFASARREQLGVPALARADSSTVIVGLKPKNASVSAGWRYLSRSALPGLRCLPAIAASIAALPLG